MNVVLFCGVVTALGWGLRGEFGGSGGAMIPGAFLGLALALSSCREDWQRKAPVFGLAGTLGMALGGNMSYGRVIGFTRGNDFVNVSFGYLSLGLIGALWGAFAAGAIGMVASPKKYHWWEVLIFVFIAYWVGRITYWLLINAIGLSMNNHPERGEHWAMMIGINLTLVAYTYLKRDPIPRRLMVWGLIAGGFGFTVGESFQILGNDLGPSYDWWKVMEQSFGFILGAGIAYGVRRECAGIGRTPPAPLLLSAFALAIVAWYVPVTTASDVIGRLREENVFANQEAYAMFAQHFRWMTNAGLILLLAVVLWRGYAGRRELEGRTRAMALLLWVLWICTALGALKKGIPAWGETALMVHQGFLALATVATLWSLLDFHHDVGWWVEPRSLRSSLAKLAALYVVVVLFVTLAGIATHGGDWLPGAHVRFESFAKPSAVID